jgi:hypothetical protein
MSETIHRADGGAGRRFFVAMAVVLLAVAFVGFAPTFYLKLLFDTPELPWYLLVHGGMLTAWFALFLAQTVLVATRRVTAHRRIGRFALAAAFLLVITTLALVLAARASGEARGITRPNPIEVIVLGDLAALAAFSILLSVGICFRHRTPIHGRAMLLASIALVIPAITRLTRFSVFGEIGPLLTPGLIAAPMLAIWANDWVVDRRIHPVTAWGSVLTFAGMMASGVLARTEFGKGFVAAISFGGG